APTSPASCWRRASWTRSSPSSPPCCSATGPGCSTTPAGPPSRSSRSASPACPTPRCCGSGCCDPDRRGLEHGQGDLGALGDLLPGVDALESHRAEVTPGQVLAHHLQAQVGEHRL